MIQPPEPLCPACGKDLLEGTWRIVHPERCARIVEQRGLDVPDLDAILEERERGKQ